MTPSKQPEYEYQWADPSPSSPTSSATSSTRLSIDFSPPLIAMVAVVGTAFLIVAYFRLVSRYLLPPLLRRWRRRRRRLRRRAFYSASSLSSPFDPESPPPPFFDSGHYHHYPFLSPYGLDDSAIKTLPLSVFSIPEKPSENFAGGGVGRDCAVCLLEFEENDYVRTLPACGHAFHLDCIDIWLRSHASCPLCRSPIFRPHTPLPPPLPVVEAASSPFVPLMAARIRPSLDDDQILASLFPDPRPASPPPEQPPEIAPEEQSPRWTAAPPNAARDFLLKRSYSFSFERSLPSERMVLEPATASPWRYRRNSGVGGGAFWRRAASPFGGGGGGGSSSAKHRVFSFRYYRGMKSPFTRRRAGFFPLSESSHRFGGGSSRRSKSISSPMFARSSVAAFSSSRLRCGDPEALLSPDRLGRR